MHLKTLLTTLVLSLSLVSCGGKFPEFPKIEQIYSPDTYNQLCIVCKVISTNPFKVKCDAKDVAEINTCNGIIGLSAKDYQKVIKREEELRHWAEKHCK